MQIFRPKKMSGRLQIAVQIPEATANHLGTGTGGFSYEAADRRANPGDQRSRHQWLDAAHSALKFSPPSK